MWIKVVNKPEVDSGWVELSQPFSNERTGEAHQGQPEGINHKVGTPVGDMLGCWAPRKGIESMDEARERHRRGWLIRKLISPKKPPRILDCVRKKMHIMPRILQASCEMVGEIGDPSPKGIAGTHDGDPAHAAKVQVA
jgi:hypothetical protein